MASPWRECQSSLVLVWRSCTSLCTPGRMCCVWHWRRSSQYRQGASCSGCTRRAWSNRLVAPTFLNSLAPLSWVPRFVRWRQSTEFCTLRTSINQPWSGCPSTVQLATRLATQLLLVMVDWSAILSQQRSQSYWSTFQLAWPLRSTRCVWFRMSVLCLELIEFVWWSWSTSGTPKSGTIRIVIEQDNGQKKQAMSVFDRKIQIN